MFKARQVETECGSGDPGGLGRGVVRGACGVWPEICWEVESGNVLKAACSIVSGQIRRATPRFQTRLCMIWIC